LQIVDKIKKYPEQHCNTREACEGLVIEFIEASGPDYGQPVGSLTEYVNKFNVKLFKILTRDGGVIVVEADDSEPTKFIIHDHGIKEDESIFDELDSETGMYL